jgi:hypothetical protein
MNRNFPWICVLCTTRRLVHKLSISNWLQMEHQFIQSTFLLEFSTSFCILGVDLITGFPSRKISMNFNFWFHGNCVRTRKMDSRECFLKVVYVIWSTCDLIFLIEYHAEVTGKFTLQISFYSTFSSQNSGTFEPVVQFGWALFLKCWLLMRLSSWSSLNFRR